MRTFIAAGLAALTLAGGLSAGTASAQGYYHRSWDRDRRHDNDAGAAVAAGIAGLALGAALSDEGRGRYVDGYYYGPPANAYDYYYGTGYYGPRHCRTREVWDPYLRRYVDQTRCW
jgi:hypothetical protein